MKIYIKFIHGYLYQVFLLGEEKKFKFISNFQVYIQFQIWYNLYKTRIYMKIYIKFSNLYMDVYITFLLGEEIKFLSKFQVWYKLSNLYQIWYNLNKNEFIYQSLYQTFKFISKFQFYIFLIWFLYQFFNVDVIYIKNGFIWELIWNLQIYILMFISIFEINIKMSNLYNFKILFLYKNLNLISFIFEINLY